MAFLVTENEPFRKRSPERIVLSCGRLKTELFENADVTTPIYHPSEHAFGSLGMTRGHFAYLFSFIEIRISNAVIEYRSLNVAAFSCGPGYFRKRFLCGHRSFLNG